MRLNWIMSIIHKIGIYEKLKTRLDYKIICIAFPLIIINTYSLFLNQTYSCDHIPGYFSNEFSLLEAIKGSFLGGRPVTIISILLNRFLALFGIGYFHYQWVMNIFTMMLMSLDCVLLYDLFDEYVDGKLKLVFSICILMALVNGCFVELFPLYGAEHAITILLGVIALYLFKGEKYKLSFLTSFLMVGSYQSYYSLFIVYGMLMVYLQTNGQLSLASVKKYVQVCFIAALSVLSVMALTRISSIIIGSNEVKQVTLASGSTAIWERLAYMYVSLHDLMIDGYGFMPYYLILIMYILLNLFALWGLYQSHQYGRFIVHCVCMIIMIISPFAFGIVVSYPTFVPRTVIPFFMALGVIFYISIEDVYSYLRFLEIKENVFLESIAMVLLIFMCFTVHGIHTGASDVLTERAIEKYEKDTGNEIKTVKAVHFGYRYVFDETYCNLTYSRMYASGHLLLVAEWADVNLLNMVTGQNYAKEYASWDECYQMYDDFDPSQSLRSFKADEQLAFDGDTLYWLLY